MKLLSLLLACLFAACVVLRASRVVPARRVAPTWQRAAALRIGPLVLAVAVGRT